MGAITLDKTDHLYWLGRYIERVYSTLKTYIDAYDKMIDSDENSYISVCKILGIPNTYNSREDFIENFGYNADNCSSILYNLYRAYDNAMVMRDEIGTHTLAYIHLAIAEMQKAHNSIAPLIELQSVTDNILAFWGCLDDEIGDDVIRNTIKSGKRIERLDMYLRFRRPKEDLEREISRLNQRVVCTNLRYNKAALMHTAAMIEDTPIDYDALLLKTFEIFR